MGFGPCSSGKFNGFDILEESRFHESQLFCSLPEQEMRSFKSVTYLALKFENLNFSRLFKEGLTGGVIFPAVFRV